MVVYVIDLGGQYSHVIWRTIRDLGYECKIKSKSSKWEEIKDAESIVFSGGPGSAPKENFGVCEEIIEKIKKGECGAPVLGICMGHQLLADRFGGIVEKGEKAEYGIMKIYVEKEDEIFKGVKREFTAWVSHFDEVKKLPPGFEKLARSEVCSIEAMGEERRKIYGVQFHPEVWHTEEGEKIIENFLKLSLKKN